MTKKTTTTIALLVVALPLLLWLDVWLGIKFGNWVESMGGSQGTPETMGLLAFMALIAVQAVAVAVYSFSKEK